MVICEKHNFLYLRIPKNASSSLAAFFIKNFCAMSDRWTEVNDANIGDHKVDINVINKYRYQYRWIHLTLQELVDNNLVSTYDAHNKDVISVLRNPFMRQISLYFFLKRGMDKSPAEFREIFKDGCHATDTSNHILQTDYAKLNGVDCGTWWMYNKLDTHIKNFCYEKGVDSSLTLPNHKGTWTPKDRKLFDEYYDQKTQDAVRKYYEKDFEKMFELETGLEVA
jgi:hypothetical protein